MAEYHILFGFKEEEVIAKIVSAIRSSGNTVTYTERTSKESITAYLERNTDCDQVVLRECMGAESFSAKDFAGLTDVRDINVVALVESRHKGTGFMDTLYAAGITSGIFVSPKYGASPGKIAELILNKRTRKAARKYYSIQENEISVDILSYEEYLTNYSILMNPEQGLNIVDRFINIVRRLSPKQVAKFIQCLPPNVKKELQIYEEFWIVIDNLRRNKISIIATKPTNLRRGLTEEQFMQSVQTDFKRNKKNKETKLSYNDTEEPENYFVKMLENKKDYIGKDTDMRSKDSVEGEEKGSGGMDYDIEFMLKNTNNNKENVKKCKVRGDNRSNEKEDVEVVKDKPIKVKKKVSWGWITVIAILAIAVIVLWIYLVFEYKI